VTGGRPTAAELRRGEAATWGRQPGAEATQRRPVSKGSLRGFATVELPIGLKLIDCPVLVSAAGGSWASLPSKPVLDREGKHVRPGGGKRQFATVVEWRSRELSDRFSAAVVALVKAAYPDALDGA
jgi:hypothetical protein